ncbi:hypothetical protein VP01_1169g5 [Puccinia sorghi]|uniref:Uncharacterized protein n=1 Tax=Puccinia sorghi TaxID=27349 RepID=A0A0L6VRB6_9BASI|nr:hypothetical protein VP01_1169g5 [Puccinia sorghi]
MINRDPALEEDKNIILCAIILSKLSTNTHNNIVNSANKDNTQLLWKAILKCFISLEASNCARRMLKSRSRKTLITYDFLKLLPSSLEKIKKHINHSQEESKIKPKNLPHHLKIHVNELKVSNTSRGESIAATMYTNKDKRCTSGTHNPNSKTHTKDKFWAIYPKKRAAFLKKREESQVSNFSNFSSLPTPVFILDSGSSSHMVSNCKFFTYLDVTKYYFYLLAVSTL